MTTLATRQLAKRLPGYAGAWPGPFILLVAVALGLLSFFLPLSWAVTLFLVVAVSLLATIQPLTALALALIAGPLGALESVIMGGMSIDSGQVLFILAVVSWISRKFIRRQFDLPKSPLTIPLFLFIAVGFASLFMAPDALLGLKELLKWLEILLVMLMVTDLGCDLGAATQDDGHQKNTASIYGVAWIVAILMIAGLTQAVIGIWQFLFRGDGPEHFLVMDRFYRAYGTFEQPNPFGGYMNLTALLALGVLIGLFGAWIQRRQGRAEQSRHGAKDYVLFRFLLVALAVLVVATATVFALLFSWSRGAWMGFLAGLTTMAILWPKRLRVGFVILLVAFLASVLLFQSQMLPPSITDRLAGFTDDLTFGDVRGVDINDENYAVLERLAHWQASLSMADDRPWLGVGFGNYGAAYADYDLINWPDALGHAHNYYLNILAETGVIGLAAYLLLWLAIVWQTWRTLTISEWPARGVVLGLMGIWVAISVHHSVDKLYVNNIYIHLGVLLGLLQLLSLHAWAGIPASSKGRK